MLTPLIRLLSQLKLDSREYRDNDHEHNAHGVSVSVAVKNMYFIVWFFLRM